MRRKLITPQMFLERARPLLAPSYALALLITDDAGEAEQALLTAMLQVFLSDTDPDDRRELRDALRRETQAAALDAASDRPADMPSQGDWRPPYSAQVDASPAQAQALASIAREDRETQRLLGLRYGCRCSAARAAALAGMTAAEAEARLSAFRGRAASSGVDGLERAIPRACRSLAERTGAAPDLAALCRAFERDASAAVGRPRRRRNIPGAVLALVGILLAALLFWLVAVLLEPNAVGETLREAGSAAACSL